MKSESEPKIKIIKYGFTGTRTGLNSSQKDQIIKILKTDIDNDYKIFCHHGDCIGADSDFHKLCMEVNKIYNDTKISVCIHPPSNDKARAFCICDNIMEPKPYLERNVDIVNSTDILIGCPYSPKEELRSGTWSTIRYAKKINKNVIILN